MARVYKCDICGKIIDDFPIHEWKLAAPLNKLCMRIQYEKLANDVDVCKDCANVIERYLFNAGCEILGKKSESED